MDSRMEIKVEIKGGSCSGVAHVRKIGTNGKKSYNYQKNGVLNTRARADAAWAGADS